MNSSAARLLYERDWDRQRIIDLLAVIDRIMTLPAELEAQLWQALTNLEVNRTMPYVTSVERIGYARGHLEGREEGIEEGRRFAAGSLVHRLLERRLGALPSALSAQVDDLPLERVEALGEALLDFNTVADLDVWLRQH